MATFDGYNPHFPAILGEEWVPIREENLVFSQSLNNIELGHTFYTVGTSPVATEARFYLNRLPEELIRYEAFTASIYPRGEENQSGPIRRVVIPVNAGNLFGDTTSSGIQVRGTTSIADALADASDQKYVRIATGNATTKAFDVYFDINNYLELLVNKRILGINLLYAAEVLFSGVTQRSTSETITFWQRNNSAQTILSYPSIYAGPTSTDTSLFQAGTITRVQMGDTNCMYPSSAFGPVTGIPWTLGQLQRFEATTTSPIQLYFNNFGDTPGGPVITVDYMAMEIIFCEERRIAFGASLYGMSGTAATDRNYLIGANPIPLYNIASLSPGISLTGNRDYVLTLSESGFGDAVLVFLFNRVGPQPVANALRELYSVPAYQGVQVNIPAPATEDIVGLTFTSQQTPVLPQLSLHTDTGTLPGVHAYGRQAVAQVWGTNAARQEVFDGGTTAAQYPQVRYYARRFGDTTVPLTLSPAVSGLGQSVSLTPGEWDELDPIIDGWKEITLQFPTAPTMGSGTNPQWVWTASTETAGNRWEVLGAEAPAVSGTSQPLTSVAGRDQLYLDTYGQPVSGGTINLSWIPQYAPAVSAVRDDQSSDAVIMFSQTPAAVSGFTIQQLNQPLSGIGLGCGVLGPEAPPFIPTALSYHRLTWTLDPRTQQYDVFNRTVANGWGTATNGQAWTTSGAAAAFGVALNAGTVLLTTGFRTTTLGSATEVMTNVNAYVELSGSVAPAFTDYWGALVVRSDGSGNNELYSELNFGPDNSVTLSVHNVVAGSHGSLASKIVGWNYTAGAKYAIRMQVIGVDIKAKAWLVDTEAEPDWQIFCAQASITAAGRAGTRQITGGGGPTVTLSYYNFLVSDISLGYTELQRMDSLTDWQTIMKATDQSLLAFNDYEARVGLAASYRIRKVNALGFAGAWSSTLSNTLPAPGVTATSVGADDRVWIFTTNSVQAGTSNLAYALGWEGEVSEDFNFPESAGQVYQTMYGRNFVTVFRPTERGGTNFSRTLLVQAAAIPPETLEDFTSLRNMAWADVPYICLRDEDGNRWFSNVTIPTGTVLHFRKIYLAPVAIVEVTDTPTPVDP